MGAWGEGMQANDTALDYIAEFTTVDGEMRKSVSRGLKSGKMTVLEILQGIDKHSGHDAKAVLGVAEFLLDHGQDLKPALKLICGHIRQERTKARLGCWRDSEARKGALDRFNARAHGRKVDMADLEIDNLGLFGRMALGTTGIEQLRKELKKDLKRKK